MVKNYQLWYFQLSCSLSFLFSFSAWGLCTLQAWIFLTNTEELQNQIHHEEKEDRQWGKFIYLTEKPMGLCQKAWKITTQQLLAPSKPCSLQWQCCGWQWPPFCWGILWCHFHIVLQQQKKNQQNPSHWFHGVWFSKEIFWNRYPISFLWTLKIADRFVEE